MNHPIEVGKTLLVVMVVLMVLGIALNPDKIVHNRYTWIEYHIICATKKCYDYKRRSRMIAVVNHIEIKPMKSLSDLKARFLCDKINVLPCAFGLIIFCSIGFEDYFLFGINVPLVFPALSMVLWRKGKYRTL